MKYGQRIRFFCEVFNRMGSVFFQQRQSTAIKNQWNSGVTLSCAFLQLFLLLWTIRLHSHQIQHFKETLQGCVVIVRRWWGSHFINVTAPIAWRQVVWFAVFALVLDRWKTWLVPAAWRTLRPSNKTPRSCFGVNFCRHRNLWFSFWTPAAAKTAATDVGGLLKRNGGAFFRHSAGFGVKMRKKHRVWWMFICGSALCWLNLSLRDDGKKSRILRQRGA